MSDIEILSISDMPELCGLQYCARKFFAFLFLEEVGSVSENNTRARQLPYWADCNTSGMVPGGQYMTKKGVAG